MKVAYLFPGQGAQFPGMGQALYKGSKQAQALFEKANDLLGFRITDVMFAGTQEDLQATQIAQPAIFLHAVIAAEVISHLAPAMVAGHSLGELSALVVSRVLSFEEGLQLVIRRADAMQAACTQVPGAMAAILGMEDKVVEELCVAMPELVMPVNYNCPGQLVIAGTEVGVHRACQALRAAGAKGIHSLAVEGAFHTPLMEPAIETLAQAIRQATFQQGICPVYQNVDAAPEICPLAIQKKLLQQLTSPVRWAQAVRHMVRDGAQSFVACGPGKALQGFVKRINAALEVADSCANTKRSVLDE
ncbi:MAG: ACP S-malonyltransferase [Bacteroidota bacterium]